MQQKIVSNFNILSIRIQMMDFCYTEIQYSSDGLKIWKSCDTYNECRNRASNNRANCYKSQGSLSCAFFCAGDLCNDEDIGGR